MEGTTENIMERSVWFTFAAMSSVTNTNAIVKMITQANIPMDP